MTEKHIRVSSLDRRRQIIKVAAEIFAEKGFRGTRTREIAARARINEAILFRHFPKKESLYWAVIDSKCRGARGRRELRTILKASAPAQALAGVAEDIFRRNLEDPARGRLFLYSALENHRLSQRFFRTHLAPYFDVLCDYIRAQIRRGAFRRVDARLAARGFLGMVAHHYQVQELFGGRRYQLFNPRKVSQTLADIWLGGMRSRNGAYSRKKS